MDPGDLPVVPLDGPQARRLADLAGVSQDLKFVIAACDKLRPLLEAGEAGDPVLVEALWTSSLVAYSRCFATGKRLGLSEADIEALPGDAIEVHRYFRAMRDKHIAHSVNPFEQVQVGALLGPDGTGRTTVLGVATLSLRHVSGTVEWLDLLQRLSEHLRHQIAGLASQPTDVALLEARQQDIDELRAREPMRVTAPGVEHTTRPRP